MRLHALILGGGQGSRLGGVRKAELRLGGTRLLDRVTARLDLATRPLLLADGGFGRNLPPEMVSLIDPQAPPAPWPGFAPASPFSPMHRTTRCSSPSPSTPPPPRRLCRASPRPLADGARASHAAFGPAPYPTNAAYRLGALRAAIGTIPADAGPRALLSALDAVAVDWAGLVEEDPFRSLNTLEDLIALARGPRRPRVTVFSQA